MPNSGHFCVDIVHIDFRIPSKLGGPKSISREVSQLFTLSNYMVTFRVGQWKQTTQNFMVVHTTYMKYHGDLPVTHVRLKLHSESLQKSLNITTLEE